MEVYLWQCGDCRRKIVSDSPTLFQIAILTHRKYHLAPRQEKLTAEDEKFLDDLKVKW